MIIRQVHHKLDNVTTSTRIPVCTGFRVVDLANRFLNFEPHVIENLKKLSQKLKKPLLQINDQISCIHFEQS